MGEKARRCTLCSINYPPEIKNCLICGGVLWGLYREDAEPDEDWKDKVKAAHGIDPLAVYQHPPDGRCTRYQHNDSLWFKHDDLLAIGYSMLEEGSIVYVNEEFHELQFYWPVEKCWNVKIIPHEGVFDDATPEDFETDA
jgi:hypothetical protein